MTFKEKDKVEVIGYNHFVSIGKVGEIIEINSYGYNFSDSKEMIQLTVEFENNIIAYLNPDIVKKI